MNDRFKFRVWQTELQVPKMKYNSGIGFINNQLDDTDCVIMQCTGLKDKNGNLIFEGDIVKQNKTIYCVTWKEGSYGFCDIRTKITYTVEYVMSKKQEVIGNIYENKELLDER